MEPQLYLFVRFLAGWPETLEGGVCLEGLFWIGVCCKEGFVASDSFSEVNLLCGTHKSHLCFEQMKIPVKGCRNISNNCINKLHVLNKNNKTEGTI